MIDLVLKKKLTAVFLKSCFLMPMFLITIAISMSPIVQAESVCDVPASNNWEVDEKVNYHQLVDNFWEVDIDDENSYIYQPITQDFSSEINVRNDSASAISFVLTPGKSYTFCYSFSEDQDSPPSNGAKADVYLMTKGNWEFYRGNYELRYENWLEEIGFLPVEFRDTITWMPFRDVHSYEKVTSNFFSVAVDTQYSSSWLGNERIEYFLVFDNWDNNRNTDQKAAGGDLNIELLVDVEDRLVLPKFTAYVLVAVLPLSCLIVPLIINSKYHSYGINKDDEIEEADIPILDN